MDSGADEHVAHKGFAPDIELKDDDPNAIKLNDFGSHRLRMLGQKRVPMTFVAVPTVSGLGDVRVTEEARGTAARVGTEVSALRISHDKGQACPGRMACEYQADLSIVEAGRLESAEEDAEKATFGPRREQLRAPSG